MSDNTTNQQVIDEHSDTDEEDEEDDGVDPEVKERERKVSEKRIIKIIHSNELGGSRENTPKLVNKIDKGKDILIGKNGKICSTPDIQKS